MTIDFEQSLGNLLARIHRDGGHYIQEHGWEKACKDAEAIIVEWLAKDDKESHTAQFRDAN